MYKYVYIYIYIHILEVHNFMRKKYIYTYIFIGTMISLREGSGPPLGSFI
jgi:hypothetical protein